MEKLSRAQAAMLARLAVSDELTPGGRRESGREASAWHRTLGVLVRRGLATRTSNGYCSHARITEAGLIAARSPEMAQRSKAFLAGYADGLAWDLDGYEDRADVERDLSGWDEATISAIGVAKFCELCGIDPNAESAWGPACADYNAGALAGALSEAHRGLPPRGSK